MTSPLHYPLSTRFCDCTPIFMQAERFASLCLQTAKTCIVPVASAISPELCAMIRGWLSINTPRWTNIKIQGSAKYLGFYLGPTAAFHGWNSQRRKWSNRGKAIARSGVPLQTAILAYQTRALTTLSYIAQLVPPPKKIFPQERGVISSLLRVPPQTFAATEMFNMESFGAYPIMPLKSYSTAIMMRTALKTLQTWPSMLTKLQDAVLSFRALSADHPYSPFSLPQLRKDSPSPYGIPFPSVFISRKLLRASPSHRSWPKLQHRRFPTFTPTLLL